MNEIKSFEEMSDKDRVLFFIKCQSLLASFHPTSKFIIREGEFEAKKQFILDFCKKYKGYCYEGENICVLLNKVFINDPKDPVESLKTHLFRPPANPYNGLSIDFAAYRNALDLVDLVRLFVEPRMEYCLFVKNNEIKIYNLQKLLKKLKVV